MKKYFILSLATLFCFSPIFGMEKDQADVINNPPSCIINNDVSKDTLKKILIEILGIQFSCQKFNRQEVIPRRFKGKNLYQLQSRQRELIPQMRELKAKLSEKEFNDLDDAAREAAQKEQEITDSSLGDIGKLYK